MTFDEINKKIETMRSLSSDHRLSKDQIFDIGLMHKQLPLSQRDWNALAKLVGWKGNAESLRGFVKSRIKRMGITNSTCDELNCDVEVDCKSSEKNADNNCQFTRDNESICQQKARDEWAAYRRYLREDARLDSLKEAIRDTVEQLKDLPKFTPIVSTDKDVLNTEAILMLSDLHIGADCNNFYNIYNTDVAQKRVDLLVSETIRYCKDFKIDKLNVVNLGDLINGIIHVNARIEQSLIVTDQIMIASEILAQALNHLCQVLPFTEIVYRSCTDNHSRVFPDKEMSIEAEQFSVLIDWYLKERLKDTSIVFANDNIDRSLGKFTLKNGKKVMFAHGHLDNTNMAFQHFTGATHEFIDYGLLGHFHCDKYKSYNQFKVFVNGSIVGTESYALSKRLFSLPSQTLLIFDKNNIVDIAIDLAIS